jgi:hypothetical protein
MIMEAGDVKVALRCEYFAYLSNPVVVLSVCREIDGDGNACRDPSIMMFSNNAFSPSERNATAC